MFGYPGYNKDGANEAVLAFAMIETAEAFANMEEIAKTPHLDALYVGPSDLSLGLTNGALPPKLDREEPEMIEAIQKIVAVAHENGIRAALHCGTPEYAARGVEWGFDMVTVGTDSAILAQGAAAVTKTFRSLIS